jgi:hypothetical protein
MHEKVFQQTQTYYIVSKMYLLHKISKTHDKLATKANMATFTHNTDSP